MKKIIVSILALVALALPSAAQFRWGPEASVDLNGLNFKQDLFTVDQAVGFSAGVKGEMMFPGIGFGLDLGLRYQQRGGILHLGEREIWSSQGYGTNRLYLHQLDIPFHLKFKYTRLGGLEETIAPYLFVGPTFTFTVAKNKLDCVKTAGGEIGLQFGLGAEIKRRWQVSASYNIGMTYSFKMDQLANVSARNRTWDLAVAYLF